jgi:RND superfamily putative drug exporter
MVSRIREAYLETNNPTQAVTQGGRRASRIVTAAALIMFSVFASFVKTPDNTLKTIAFGLGIGVLIDAFLIRMTLVPAVLALLGHRSWRLPRVLDRALPNVDIEGATVGQSARHAPQPAPVQHAHTGRPKATQAHSARRRHARRLTPHR